jgi:steroid delta-isomerase-like uncharacterized protein
MTAHCGGGETIKMISEAQLNVNQECVRRHLQFENAQDMEGTLSTLHPECVFEDLPLNKIYRGIDGARKYYAELWQAFDVTVESRLRHWTLEGNLIAETTFVGPHRAEFLGNRPIGKSIRLPLVVVVTFRDGLMAGERFYYDLAMLLRQIGASDLTHNG